MIRCSTVRNTARSTGNSNLRSASRSSITDRQELSCHSRSKSRGGPIRLASIVVVSPFSTADSSIPVSVTRAPDHSSRSSSPVSLSASSRPRVASTVWRGLPLTRWLSTIWRYSKPPDRLTRKYMLDRWLPARSWRYSPVSQGDNAILLALQKRSNPGFPTADCGFQPHFEQATVKVRSDRAAPDHGSGIGSSRGEVAIRLFHQRHGRDRPASPVPCNGLARRGTCRPTGQRPGAPHQQGSDRGKTVRQTPQPLQ